MISISTHAPLAGRDWRGGATVARHALFQPTRPLRGATCTHIKLGHNGCISTHAPLAGRDVLLILLIIPVLFYFNPRAPCGARQHQQSGRQLRQLISTHAPLAGRDDTTGRAFTVRRYFNPRAPCGARQDRFLFVPVCSNFNPRAPCGARPVWIRVEIAIHDFNPRAPCGARQIVIHSVVSSFLFQPTRPLRGATHLPLRLNAYSNISTHAPLAGRDSTTSRCRKSALIFQPTRPLRGATARFAEPRALCRISTHAPLAGRDELFRALEITLLISTHAPLAGRDLPTAVPAMGIIGFQPTRPLRGATQFKVIYRMKPGFQPTRPLRGATAKVYKSLCTFLR